MSTKDTEDPYYCPQCGYPSWDCYAYGHDTLDDPDYCLKEDRSV